MKQPAILRDAYLKLVDLVGNRSTDYRQTFGSPAGQRVLMDLAPFCLALGSCVVAPNGEPVDIERTLMGAGRHQVWQRINDHLHLTPEQLYGLYDGRPVARATGDE